MLLVEAFQRWASLGRSLTVAGHRPSPTWHPVRRLIDASHEMLRADRRRLERLLEESRLQLHPLDDPLALDVGMHRWLASDREEAYSDWLQWILQELSPAQLVRLLGIMGDDANQILADSSKRQTTREVWVPHGHEESEGRLDILINWDSGAFLVVEVKKESADDAVTDKHTGYVESFAGRHTRLKEPFILIATAGKHPQYDGFRLVTWDDVCLRLRWICKDLLAEKGNRKPILAIAMILAFVGAVEQNLLGYSRSAMFTTRVMEYLERATRR